MGSTGPAIEEGVPPNSHPQPRCFWTHLCWPGDLEAMFSPFWRTWGWCGPIGNNPIRKCWVLGKGSPVKSVRDPGLRAQGHSVRRSGVGLAVSGLPGGLARCKVWPGWCVWSRHHLQVLRWFFCLFVCFPRIPKSFLVFMLLALCRYSFIHSINIYSKSTVSSALC